METIPVLLLLLAGETVVVLVLINLLGRAWTQLNEQIGRNSYLETELRQRDLSIAGQQRFGPNPSRGWWLPAAAALLAMAVAVFSFA